MCKEVTKLQTEVQMSKIITQHLRLKLAQSEDSFGTCSKPVNWSLESMKRTHEEQLNQFHRRTDDA